MPEQRGNTCTTVSDIGANPDENQLCCRLDGLRSLRREELRRRVLATSEIRPSVCFAAARSPGGRSDDHEGNDHENGNPGGFDEAELEALLRELLGTLIPLLDPSRAEVVWRAELLDQPAPVIARELNLCEHDVKKHLREGRGDLLGLILLTLQQSLEE